MSEHSASSEEHGAGANCAGEQTQYFQSDSFDTMELVAGALYGRRLLISCGGTGGHFYPGLSLARELVHQGGRAKLLLSGIHAHDQKITAKAYGIEAEELPMMPSFHKVSNLPAFLIGLFRGVALSRRVIREFAPDGVLGMGSFASVPPLIAAKLERIRVFLHDGNARIGKANRIFSRWAERLGCAFMPVNADAIRCRWKHVGMPLRQELADAPKLEKRAAIGMLNEYFQAKLDPSRTTILIFGGSQGAKIFNELLPGVLGNLFPRDFQVIHLAGPGKVDSARLAYRNCRFPLLLLASAEDMNLFLSAADLVVSRAGGSTIAELEAFGVPAVLIPYPYAAEDHQSANATDLAGAGGAVMVSESEDLGPRLTVEIDLLLAEPEKRREMAELAQSKARRSASLDMLEFIFAEK
ncbi:MAG: UDP-N-acetylglucosamine--N-acetylmuramyl-(pentapeptide) pyrophosphoryl-undecaprenol N-acetylglucosamine transferase [Victivallaceae bacterium]|nr:UDP-N-acetylglucosamine--N-acetylmuramyl-(pentapeptide) pyrophosphoryl-undecaprenol N-acetylglucosamine transferase [Victivallaceae bacterium]